MAGVLKEDLSGRRFGRLVVSGRDRTKVSASKKVFWSVKCDCGKHHISEGQSLKEGKARSCGCLTGDTSRRHGFAKTPTYKAWQAMKQRCGNEQNRNYWRYGQRGIKVCDRWLESFENFLEDMGTRPGAEYTLERSNNDLGYSAENCIWATMKVQNNNVSRNVWLVFDGKRKTIAQWAEVVDVSRKTIATRIRNGWTVRDSLTLPSRNNA